MSDIQQHGSLREKIAAETKARKARYANWVVLVQRAHQAGLAAGEACIPRPMIVSEGIPLSDLPKPGGKSWFVSEGLCGFAWVKFPKGNSSFAIWAKKYNGLPDGLRFRKAYNTGIDLWCGLFNQSVARKEAYCQAFAKVMQEGGIDCYADSRLD